jgi:hypothetical protein
VKRHLDPEIGERLQRRIARRKRVHGREIHLAIERFRGRRGGILIRRYDADRLSFRQHTVNGLA